eukprot:scaffold23269_cov57-Attheya_sp.AAC.1
MYRYRQYDEFCDILARAVFVTSLQLLYETSNQLRQQAKEQRATIPTVPTVLSLTVANLLHPPAFIHHSYQSQ